MTTQLLLVLALLAAAITMFIANRPRMDAVGLLMIVPMVNLLALYVLAFAEWPGTRRAPTTDKLDSVETKRGPL